MVESTLVNWFVSTAEVLLAMTPLGLIKIDSSYSFVYMVNFQIIVQIWISAPYLNTALLVSPYK